MTIKRFKGGLHTDERGSVSFVNDFNFKEVKRFYMVENVNQKYIRAFHGHMKESKYVMVVSGSILLCAVALENTKNPSRKNKVTRIILDSKYPEVVYIPPKYANGFKSLEKGSKVIFFSTSTLKESQNDDFRFPADYWGKEVWDE